MEIMELIHAKMNRALVGAPHTWLHDWLTVWLIYLPCVIDFTLLHDMLEIIP